MSFLIKFFTSLAMQFVNALLRDKANRDLGASEQRDKNNEATIEKMQEWSEIDAQSESTDDAFGVLGNFSKLRRRASAELPTTKSKRSTGVKGTK